MISMPFKKFGDIHQYKEIKAGESGRIFYLTIPVSHAGFLWYLYASWYPDTYLVMKIDGEVAEVIRRQIGEPNKPFKFNIPYLITSEIEFWGYNDSSDDHYFEVFCDGEVYDESLGRRQIYAQINSSK